VFDTSCHLPPNAGIDDGKSGTTKPTPAGLSIAHRIAKSTKRRSVWLDFDSVDGHHHPLGNTVFHISSLIRYF
jgi:hypothetical protein